MEIKTSEEIMKEKEIAEAKSDDMWFNFLKKKWVAIDDLLVVIDKVMDLEHELCKDLKRQLKNELSNSRPKKGADN